MAGKRTQGGRRRPRESRRSGIPHITGVLVGLFFILQAVLMVNLFRMRHPPPDAEAEVPETVEEAQADEADTDEPAAEEEELDGPKTGL